MSLNIFKVVKSLFTHKRDIKKEVESGIEPKYQLEIKDKVYHQEILGFDQTELILELIEQILSRITESELKKKANQKMSIGNLLTSVREIIKNEKPSINRLFQILYRTDDNIDFNHFGVTTHFLVMIQDFFLLNNIVIIMQDISESVKSMMSLIAQHQTVKS